MPVSKTDSFADCRKGRFSPMHEHFKGTEVSRKSVAALVVECIRDSKNFSHKNLGVNKPNTDGDKPAFY
jgi:hypothetical protein